MKNGSVVKKANHGIGIVRELGADTCVGCWMGYIVDDMPYSYICGIDGQAGWLGALFGSRWCS